MWYVINSNELYHHGIKGQKWGVRRFQNADGSYTKAGLARYRTSLDRYNEAVASYQKGKASRKDVRDAKRKMNSDYKRLKFDARADKGKQLYAQGKTITGNAAKRTTIQAGISIGSVIANNVLKTYADQKISDIASSAIFAGGTAVNIIMGTRTGIQNRNLRAYYGHSRSYKPYRKT